MPCASCLELPPPPFPHCPGRYERLLDRTKHVKVWISFATFEASSGVGGGVEDARAVYRRAYDALKEEVSRRTCTNAEPDSLAMSSAAQPFPFPLRACTCGRAMRCRTSLLIALLFSRPQTSGTLVI